MTRQCDTTIDTHTRSLTRDAVATATLAVIDDRGLHAATMRAIAHRLGVKAQSLYTHIDSRDDLLDAVADHIVNQIDADPIMHRDPTDPWQLHLTNTAHAVRRCAHRHPRAFVLIATRPAHLLLGRAHLLSHHWATDTQTIFTRSGFDDDAMTFAYRAFDALLLGSLLLETSNLTNDAAATAPAHPTHVSTHPRQHPLTDNLTRRRDDNFATDLYDVINRIDHTSATAGQRSRARQHEAAI